MHLRSVTFIIKVAERCNIDCDYCYYYKSGDDTWKSNPPLMKPAVFDLLAFRLAEFARDNHVEEMMLAFHGGEPMLADPVELERFIRRVKDCVPAVTRLDFAIQTNGTVWNREWLEFFERTQIHIGVSIDGPSEIHDAHRRTKRGKPTHHKTDEFLRVCGAMAQAGRIPYPSTITVINPEADTGAVADYLRQRYALRLVAFILPDDAANDILFNDSRARKFGASLIDLYTKHAQDRRIRNKEISHILGRIASRSPGASTPGTIEYIGVSVQSGGEMKVNEELIPTGAWRKAFPVCDLHTQSMQSYFERAEFQDYLAMASRIPSACSGCKWRVVCRGGSMHERRSPSNGFNSRSVFCAGYQDLYSYVFRDLVAHGLPERETIRKLAMDDIAT